MALAEELAARLEALQAGEKSLAALERRVRDGRAVYEAEAARLTELRTAAAGRLDMAVERELAPTELDSARFRTFLDTLAEAQWAARGRDRVSSKSRPIPGAPFAPLTKLLAAASSPASSIALKVALAERGDART